MAAFVWYIQAISNPLRHRGYVAGDLNGPEMKALFARNWRLAHRASIGERVYVSEFPTEAPGLTPAQIIEAVKPHLSATLFPVGETAGWWVKCAQLDLEAKGLLKRAPKAPVRVWKA